MSEEADTVKVSQREAMKLYGGDRVFVIMSKSIIFIIFFQAEDDIRVLTVTGVQTCALPIYMGIRMTLSNPERLSQKKELLISQGGITRTIDTVPQL